MSNTPRSWPIWLAILGCIAAIVWLTADHLSPAPNDTQFEVPKRVNTRPAEKNAPRYPLTADENPDKESPEADMEAAAEPAGESVPVDGDLLRAELISVFGPGLGEILRDDELDYRVVVSLDNLTGERPARRLWPVIAELEPFAAIPADDDLYDESYYASPDNYARYDALTQLITSAEPALVATAYRRVYPQLQDIYRSLGYPDGYLNDRVVDLIDHLSATPTPSEPVRLVRPGVLYEYADTQLEALSSGQKLLLRTGPENGMQLRLWLEAVRTEIVE